MGNFTPHHHLQCPSTSICDGGADELGLELNNDSDIRKSMNPSSNSCSSSESSDDESGNEQSDATTEPLGVDLRDGGGASANQDTMHPAVSSGDLNLIQALKSERCLKDEEKHFFEQHSFVANTGYSFPSRTISGSVRHSSIGS